LVWLTQILCQFHALLDLFLQKKDSPTTADEKTRLEEKEKGPPNFDNEAPLLIS